MYSLFLTLINSLRKSTNLKKKKKKTVYSEKINNNLKKKDSEQFAWVLFLKFDLVLKYNI